MVVGGGGGKEPTRTSAKKHGRLHYPIQWTKQGKNKVSEKWNENHKWPVYKKKLGRDKKSQVNYLKNPTKQRNYLIQKSTVQYLLPTVRWRQKNHSYICRWQKVPNWISPLTCVAVVEWIAGSSGRTSASGPVRIDLAHRIGGAGVRHCAGIHAAALATDLRLRALAVWLAAGLRRGRCRGEEVG